MSTNHLTPGELAMEERDDLQGRLDLLQAMLDARVCTHHVLLTNPCADCRVAAPFKTQRIVEGV